MITHEELKQKLSDQFSCYDSTCYPMGMDDFAESMNIAMYRWMNDNDLSWDDLTQDDIDEFDKIICEEYESAKK